jgi:DNA mismatch repair protein MutS
MLAVSSSSAIGDYSARIMSDIHDLPPDRPLADTDATPMMAQYLAIKRAHADCLLFYRMGDFYEMFFEDAVNAAAALDIALTKRGKHAGEDIAMCGVPVVSHEAYLMRLIRKGFRVAVCEQMENPAEAKKRGAKSVVERGVVRVVTPGTLTEDSLLDSRAHNYLAALAEAQGQLGLAWLDLSTGDFAVQAVGAKSAAAAIARLSPGELLMSERILNQTALIETLADWKRAFTPLPSARFDSDNGRKRLEAFYGVAVLDGFGSFSRAELAAAGALVDYVELTQKGKLPRLSPLTRLAEGALMEIDAATRRNLELTETLAGERKGSLLACIDRTVSGAGARLLAEMLAAPLTDPAEINRRLDYIDYFVSRPSLRDEMRESLRRCPDIARALSRITLGRGGPRDLANIGNGLAEVPGLRDALLQDGLEGIPELVSKTSRDLGEHGPLVERLKRALAEDLPLLARDGGFVRAGYNDSLDELRAWRDESRQKIAALQAHYVDVSGIASLKIKHNNVLGYYIEVPPKQADRMGEPFIHRQTIASSVRYATVELGELEDRIRSAGDKALALELELFTDLIAEVMARVEDIARAANALAGLDVATALALLAAERRFCRPHLDNSVAFDIKGGRHPVVEAAIEGSFVANDCNLENTQRLWLITGPNMAGKSTFLRQNAVIAILAQMGSFVPADEARIGIVDRLFSRVGAADDLARGRSTFMVEMVETAAILNQSGPRALVILDEIGRGTATYDGLSIAWAVVEHLHETNKCRALFATHYHELTALTNKLPSLSCHCMRVKEWQGEVVFLHEVAKGAADRSYGIHVARLAGLPQAVLARAETVLHTLEKNGGGQTNKKLVDDLPLFSAMRPTSPPAPKGPSEIERAVAALNPDEMTPREALDALYRLKGLPV